MSFDLVNLLPNEVLLQILSKLDFDSRWESFRYFLKASYLALRDEGRDVGVLSCLWSASTGRTWGKDPALCGTAAQSRMDAVKTL